MIGYLPMMKLRAVPARCSAIPPSPPPPVSLQSSAGCRRGLPSDAYRLSVPYIVVLLLLVPGETKSRDIQNRAVFKRSPSFLVDSAFMQTKWPHKRTQKYVWTSFWTVLRMSHSSFVLKLANPNHSEVSLNIAFVILLFYF